MDGDDETRALLERGLIQGVDFCSHAVRLSAIGRVVAAEHLARCAVCLRRWRVTEAELQPWAPMEHDSAQVLIPEMAAAFASPERGETYRPFYAHVARCAECERRLAELTYDSTLPAPDLRPLDVRT